MLDEQNIYLIGFIVASDNDESNLYALYVSNDNDRPITLGGEILFFHKPELAISAIEKSDDQHKDEFIEKIPKDVEIVFDISYIFHLLRYEDIDNSSEIVNFLNILFDFMKSINVEIPKNYQENLNRLADHLTFENNYSDFFEKEIIERSLIVESLYWYIGAVFANSKIIQ